MIYMRQTAFDFAEEIDADLFVELFRAAKRQTQIDVVRGPEPVIYLREDLPKKEGEVPLFFPGAVAEALFVRSSALLGAFYWQEHQDEKYDWSEQSRKGLTPEGQAYLKSFFNEIT